MARRFQLFLLKIILNFAIRLLSRLGGERGGAAGKMGCVLMLIFFLFDISLCM